MLFIIVLNRIIMHTMYTICQLYIKEYILFMYIFSYLLVVGQDFNPPNATVTFSSGQSPTSQCINVNIISDDNFEGDHNFQVELTSISPAVAMGTGATATIIIQDDDSKCLKSSYDA